MRCPCHRSAAGSWEEGTSKSTLGDCDQKDGGDLVLKTLLMTFGVRKEGHKAELKLDLLSWKMALSVPFVRVLLIFNSSDNDH